MMRLSLILSLCLVSLSDNFIPQECPFADSTGIPCNSVDYKVVLNFFLPHERSIQVDV